MTGYLIPNDDDFDFGGGDDEGENSELDEQVPDKMSIKQLKKQLAKAGTQESDDANDDSDDDDDENVGEEAGSDDDEDMDDDDMDDDDQEGGDDEDDDEDDDDDDEDDSDEEIVEPQPKKLKQQNGVAATNGKAEKKKGDQPKAAAAVVKGEKSKEQQKPVVKTLIGGLKIEDIRVGKGPDAKHGKKVQVYYEGRLATNNKVFDSTKSGQGFQFQLGRGEVIRGWDTGVAGMKVGGKRRITCPPGFAYGAKGSPPVIPGNATLVFDVELRGVK